MLACWLVAGELHLRSCGVCDVCWYPPGVPESPAARGSLFSVVRAEPTGACC